MMTPIHVDTDLQLADGLFSYEIDSERKLNLTFRCQGDCRIFVRIKHAADIRVRTYSARNAKVTYLFWNEDDCDLKMDETHEALADSDVTVAYGELNDHAIERDTYLALLEPGARGLLSSANLVQTRRSYNMQVVNYAPKTYGNMENYAVVLEKGKLMINAVGKMVKGASHSESHQTSRALSFAQGQNTEILPQLLIDENDVQASHAMSIGQVDPEQLYYMESRGLDRNTCTALLAQGYLLPIADTIDDADLRQMLKDEMERKLEELCSM